MNQEERRTLSFNKNSSFQYNSFTIIANIFKNSKIHIKMLSHPELLAGKATLASLWYYQGKTCFLKH